MSSSVISASRRSFRATQRSLRPLYTIAQPRHLSTTARMDEKFKPAKRVAGQKLDVWSIVNEAAAASPKQPIGEWAEEKSEGEEQC